MTFDLRQYCRSARDRVRLLFHHEVAATVELPARRIVQRNPVSDSHRENTMALFNFWSRKPERPTYDDIFLETRERVAEQRVADTEMLDSMHDDAKTHMLLLFGEARQCMVTDPARAQQLMRLALAQGATLEAVAQERYQTATGSLDKSFKAIAKAALEARKALPAAAPKVVEAAEVKPMVKAPQVTPKSTPPKERFSSDDFDSDYAPSRNGKK